MVSSVSEHQTAIERLRHYATQARAAAAGKAVSGQMRLYQMIKKSRLRLRSFAPIAGRRHASAMRPRAAAARGWSGVELAQAARAGNLRALVLGRRGAAGLAAGGQGGGMAPTNAAVVALARRRIAAQAGNGLSARMALADARLAQRKRWRLNAGLPSLAPRMSGAAAEAVAPGSAARLGVPEISGPRGGVQSPERLAPRARGRAAVVAGEAMDVAFAHSAAAQQRAVAEAVQNYFFQASRLPPAAGAAFDPLLTPAWAGVKLPG